jgi:hypothetical protein
MLKYWCSTATAPWPCSDRRLELRIKWLRGQLWVADGKPTSQTKSTHWAISHPEDHGWDGDFASGNQARPAQPSVSGLAVKHRSRLLSSSSACQCSGSQSCARAIPAKQGLAPKGRPRRLPLPSARTPPVKWLPVCEVARFLSQFPLIARRAGPESERCSHVAPQSWVRLLQSTRPFVPPRTSV